MSNNLINAVFNVLKNGEDEVRFLLTNEQVSLLNTGHKEVIHHGEERTEFYYPGFGFYRDSDWAPNIFQFKKLKASHINEMISLNKVDTNRISDGTYTFGELYDLAGLTKPETI